MAEYSSAPSNPRTSAWRRQEQDSSLGRWRRLRLWAQMLLKDTGWVRFFFNTRTPVMQDVYRSAHPLPYQLRNAAKQGIRTVVDLRGLPHEHGSYLLERETCERYGMRLLQFRMRSRDLPRADEIQAFWRLLQHIEYPALFHCKSGADRVGLAGALILMLRADAEPERALQQLSLRHGHIRQAKTGILDFFIKRYAEHHARHGTGLLQWIEHDYDLAGMRAEFRSQWWASFITDRILRRE